VKLHTEGLRISVQPTWLTVLVKSDIEDMGYERAATITRNSDNGKFEPGKYADMTVLSGDIFTMPGDSIIQVVPLKTIVGGHVVYERKN
jgi:predicted amidohydrolase YtcJ